MRTLKHLQYTGRKSRVGKITFDEKGRMCVFVGYCDDCRGKCVMSLDEAKKFASAHKGDSMSFSSKLIFYMLKRRKLNGEPENKPGIDKESIKKELLSDLAKALQG